MTNAASPKPNITPGSFFWCERFLQNTFESKGTFLPKSGSQDLLVLLVITSISDALYVSHVMNRWAEPKNT